MSALATDATPSTIQSKRVPTEYDVETEQAFGLAIITLVDDRSRRYSGFSLRGSLARAERAQDPRDPIHAAPFPAPGATPWPDRKVSVSIAGMLREMNRRTR